MTCDFDSIFSRSKFHQCSSCTAALTASLLHVKYMRVIFNPLFLTFSRSFIVCIPDVFCRLWSCLSAHLDLTTVYCSRDELRTTIEEIERKRMRVAGYFHSTICLLSEIFTTGRERERDSAAMLDKCLFLSFCDPLESNHFPHHLCLFLVWDETFNHHNCSKQRCCRSAL